MAIKGINEARKRMKLRARRFSGGAPYTQTAKELSRSIAQNVNVGGRPKWEKRKYDYPHPILDETGKMRDKAESTALRWSRFGNTHKIIVTSTFYGYIHQYIGVRTKIGGSVKRIIRKFVVIQEFERKRMRDFFRDAF